MRISAAGMAVVLLAAALALGGAWGEEDYYDGSPTPYYSPTPPAPQTAVSTASARLPEAVCPGRSFADLVADECQPPKYDPAKSRVKADAPPRTPKEEFEAPTFVVTTTAFPPKPDFDFDKCEEELTIRELQRNILETKDVQCVAQILIQTGSVTGIEGGFRIDPDFNFRPNCGLRQFDPDVVALKGIALGILAGSEYDKPLIRKIADGVVPSFFPPGEGVRKDMLNPDEFLEVLRNLRTLRVAFDEDANTVPPCKIHRPKAKKTGPHKVHYPPPQHIYPSGHEGRRLLAAFTEASQRVPIAFPRPSRQLQCSDCTNGDSYPCAYCWQQDVCGDLYWCQ